MQYTIKIFSDGDATSPRECDNLGTLALTHKRYTLGDTQDVIDFNAYDSWQEVQNELEKMNAVFLPVFMYDHSGLAFNTTGFNDAWDSGQVGYAFALPDKIRKEYGVKRITKDVRAKVLEVLKQEVKTYGQYVSGDVYGFMILDSEGEVLDSCGGFYEEAEARAEAQAIIDANRLPHEVLATV